MPCPFFQRHQQAIGDGFGGIICDDIARFETAIGVISLFRFCCNNFCFGCQCRQGQTGPRYHSTTADGGHDHVQSASLFHEFLGTGTLACNHARVVIGMHKIAARLLLYLCERCLTRCGGRFAFGNDPAVSADRVLFRLGGGVGHDDVAGYPTTHRRIGQAGRMVARRMGGHAQFCLIVCQSKHGICGTAHFERTRFLEIFAFEK